MSKFIPGGRPRFKHQQEGLRRILDTKGVTALLMDPGTGKTFTALDYCSIMALKMPETPEGVREARVLVAAPLAAVDSWLIQASEGISPQVNYWVEVLGGTIVEKGEALAARSGNRYVRGSDHRKQKVHETALHLRRSHGIKVHAEGHTVDPRKGIAGFPTDRPRLIMMVVNLDTFARRDKYKSKTLADHMLESVKRFGPDLIIVDELHKLKSPSSNTSRLLARIGQLAPKRLGLTGTVMPKGPLDVFAQWRFLEPEAFGRLQGNGRRKNATFSEFRERFAIMGGFMGREVVGYQNLDELQDIMAKNSIVVKKEDALDLPKTTDTVVPFDLSTREQKAYEDVQKELVTQHEDGSYSIAENPLTRALRLRQITSGFLPNEDGEIKDLGSTKTKVIASVVNDTLEGEKRVVVFCQFSREIEELSKRLATAGTRVEVITGSTPQAERLAIRERFGTETEERIVLVAQVSTLSLAVNELVTASHAVYGSMTLQRADYIQSKDRLNRLGQKRPVTFWHVEARGSIDEVIRSSHQEGTDLEAAVLQHIYQIEHVT